MKYIIKNFSISAIKNSSFFFLRYHLSIAGVSFVLRNKEVENKERNPNYFKKCKGKAKHKLILIH
jgi:hypothetical protein